MEGQNKTHEFKVGDVISDEFGNWKLTKIKDGIYEIEKENKRGSKAIGIYELNTFYKCGVVSCI
jgi:hypothetical protein